MNCLVNADVFLMISGQRSYFFEQRLHFQHEIDRLYALYQKFRIKKYNWKTKYDQLHQDNEMTINRLELELKRQIEKNNYNRRNFMTQTDIDCYHFAKMQRDYDNVSIYKNLVIKYS